MNNIIIQVEKSNRKSINIISTDMQDYYIAFAPEFISNRQIMDIFRLYNKICDYNMIKIIPKRESEDFSKINTRIFYYLGDILVQIWYKNIKSLLALPSKHEKSICVESPFFYSDQEIKLIVNNLIMHSYALNKLPSPSPYLNLELNKYRAPYECNNDFFCYFNGLKFKLSFEKDLYKGSYIIEHNEIILPKISKKEIRSSIKKIYIDYLASIIPKMLDKWVTKMNLGNRNIIVQYRGPAYGMCYCSANKIDLSTILGAFPDKCIESVLLHELVHFFIPEHNKDFYSLMDYWWYGW